MSGPAVIPKRKLETDRNELLGRYGTEAVDFSSSWYMERVCAEGLLRA